LRVFQSSAMPAHADCAWCCTDTDATHFAQRGRWQAHAMHCVNCSGAFTDDGNGPTQCTKVPVMEEEIWHPGGWYDDRGVRNWYCCGNNDPGAPGCKTRTITSKTATATGCHQPVGDRCLYSTTRRLDVKRASDVWRFCKVQAIEVGPILVGMRVRSHYGDGAGGWEVPHRLGTIARVDGPGKVSMKLDGEGLDARGEDILHALSFPETGPGGNEYGMYRDRRFELFSEGQGWRSGVKEFLRLPLQRPSPESHISSSETDASGNHRPPRWWAAERHHSNRPYIYVGAPVACAEHTIVWRWQKAAIQTVLLIGARSSLRPSHNIPEIPNELLLLSLEMVAVTDLGRKPGAPAPAEVAVSVAVWSVKHEMAEAKMCSTAIEKELREEVAMLKQENARLAAEVATMAAVVGKPTLA